MCLQVPERCNAACAAAYMPVYRDCYAVLQQIAQFQGAGMLAAFDGLNAACQLAQANVGNGPTGAVDVHGRDTGVSNLALDLPTGNCHFDECVTDGSCAQSTAHGPDGGSNGVRVCGAASSSTVGWGGEPDRAIDNGRSGTWGDSSCTHTDASPAWWQLDLGRPARIDHVAVYHRTDCCQDRLEGASVIVSSTPDFSSGSNCEPLSDHTHAPEESACDGNEGQFITVSNPGSVVVTICEAEVWGSFIPGGRPYVGGWVAPPSEDTADTVAGAEIDLTTGLPTGGCAFDPCVADGSCAVDTNNVCGGGCAGTNGVRRCGAASSSTVGWGGEPDRAIDDNSDGNWGGGSCTHTDAAPAWWQVDLGAPATVNRVSVWHRTNCCQDRLASANIVVSSTDDFSAGTTCGTLSDYSNQPETTVCDSLKGQYVTVTQEGGTSEGAVVTICEVRSTQQPSPCTVRPACL